MARKARNRVDVNTAGHDELATVPGIGANLAAALVRYREEHGQFASVDQLEAVPGVGSQSLESLREHVTVSGGARTPAAKPGNGSEQGRRAAKQGVEAAAHAGERATGAAAAAAKAGAETARRAAENDVETLRHAGTRAPEAAQVAQQQVEQHVGSTAERGRQDVRAVARSSQTLLETVREANAAWLEFVQDQMWANLQTAGKLAGCRSPKDVMEVQAEYVRGSIERLADEQARFAALASRMGAEALRQIKR